MWTIIDLEDMNRILEFPYTWFSNYFKDIDGFYAIATQYSGTENNHQKRKSVLLHQYILGENINIIDHINHNTLDNRKENLRIITKSDNATNRKSKNKNNTSGYRNVSWNTRENKWFVQLQIDGKNTCLGKFSLDKLDDAGIFAEEMRQKYYEEYAGNA